MASRPKYQLQILEKIESFAAGSVFSAADFYDIADNKTVNKALMRICNDGKIRKIMQGIFDIPEYSKLIGEYSVPQISKVAVCLSRKYHWTIAPSGDTALNQLHISTQVPTSWEYVSDGPYKTYEIGNRTLQFKHVMPKEIIGYQMLTIMIIQAIRALGKDRITDEQISRFRLAIPVGDRSTVMAESATSAEWVRKIIRRICEE